MSAFLLVEVMVEDPALYAKYMERVPAIVAKHKGRYVVRSARVTPNWGDWAPDRIVLIEFESLADLRACFASAEYAEIAPFRERSTKMRSVVIEQ
jgi:uncharacterized protein (DUF1330 family)